MADPKNYLDFTGLGLFKTENDKIYAPKVSPVLTGTPKAPTAATGTNTQQLATTEFVQQEIAGITHAVVPRASVNFADLPDIATVAIGSMYNIKDAFDTTTDFVEGAGKHYGAGQNIVAVEYSTGTAQWDVFSTPVDFSGVWAAINKKLEVVDTIPADPEENDVILYVGNTTADYIKGGVYQYDGSEWANLSGMTPIATSYIEGKLK